MSTRAIILLSLLVNLALASWAYHLHSRRAVTTGATTTPEGSIHDTAGNLVPHRTVQVATESKPGEFSWGQVESADYKDYIAKLRGIGCPEITIRDIILADVNKLYAEKLKALLPNGGRREYWQRQPSYYSKAERERQENHRAIMKEKSELLVALLGVDPIKVKQQETGVVDHYDRLLSFLPEDKKAAAREIHERYERQAQKFSVGFQDDEDRKQVKVIREQRLAAMAQILTPEEMKRYDLNTSQVATQLRYDLDGFKPSQQEFEKIYELRKAREDDLAYVYDQEDKAGQEKRRNAVTEVDAQIKALVGEERFAEYKRAQEYSYKELVRTLERHELPEELAGKVYEVKTAVEENAKKLRTDTSLTSVQRTEALKAMRTQTEDFMKQQLGEKAFNSYKRQGGSWLNSLNR
ncbi:MAG TPA: hypothetical protein VK530_02600 [Candidatus Acidoferrum sp.]|nr:hypothetical protein [Candidatus Acidoferrum sp.]